MSSRSIADLIFDALVPQPGQPGQWTIDGAGLEQIARAFRAAMGGEKPGEVADELMAAIGFLLQRGDAPAAAESLLQLARSLQQVVTAALAGSATSRGAHAQAAAVLIGRGRLSTSPEDAAELDRRGKVTRLADLAPPVRIR